MITLSTTRSGVKVGSEDEAVASHDPSTFPVGTSRSDLALDPSVSAFGGGVEHVKSAEMHVGHEIGLSNSPTKGSQKTEKVFSTGFESRT